MKKLIRHKLRLLTEEVIDGQKMTPALQSLCNTVSVNSYHEVLGRIIAAIGYENENPELWEKIKKPLEMLKDAQHQIDKEKHTDNLGNYTPRADGMTGDSMADEADTWWAAIQSTLCELGPEFQ